MNIYAKFHRNRCAVYRDGASREMAVNGGTDRRTDGQTTERHNASRRLLYNVLFLPLCLFSPTFVMHLCSTSL